MKTQTRSKTRSTTQPLMVRTLMSVGVVAAIHSLGFAQSKPAAKPTRMPAAVQRQSIAPEKFYETPPVTLLQMPARPATNASRVVPKSLPELPHLSIKEPAPVLAGAPSAPAVPVPAELPAFSKLELPEMKATEDKLVPFSPFSKAETQMFEAFLLLDDQKRDLAAYAAFARLIHTNESYGDAARWGFARSAQSLGLRVQYETIALQLLEKNRKVPEESQKWQKSVYEHLITHADPVASIWVQSINDKVLRDPPSPLVNDAYHLLRGLRLSAEKNLSAALQEFSQIQPDSKLYGQRVHQEALALYRQGKLNLALEALRQGFLQHPKSFASNDLRTKAALLWGRLAFQSREFKQAFEAYSSVPKNSPKWPEAMMEQALTQILFSDYEGAAGNMFTLHTDFFKKSFAPDSYLIRAIGYLNLCQYPDALQSVQDLQRKYRPMAEAMATYEKSGAKDDYEVIREFAKNPQARSVRGLARPLLFAWTQDPGFERHQERINQIEDELAAFQNLSLEMIKKERELAQKIVQLGQKSIAKNTRDAERETLQREIETTKIEHRMMSEGRKSLAAMRGSYLTQMENLKDTRKKLAAQALQQRRTILSKNLKHVLDQAEVLLYEIYAGAGDEIRFEVAGGTKEERKAAILKGIKENELKWKFKGEIWEDELGHFRSSLTNKCSGEDSLQKKVSRK